jgi:hypothetical protein
MADIVGYAGWISIEFAGLHDDFGVGEKIRCQVKRPPNLTKIGVEISPSLRGSPRKP